MSGTGVHTWNVHESEVTDATYIRFNLPCLKETKLTPFLIGRLCLLYVGMVQTSILYANMSQNLKMVNLEAQFRFITEYNSFFC